MKKENIYIITGIILIITLAFISNNLSQTRFKNSKKIRVKIGNEIIKLNFNKKGK